MNNHPRKKHLGKRRSTYDKSRPEASENVSGRLSVCFGQEHAGAHHVLGVAPAAGRGLSADEGVEGVTAAVRLGLAQGSGLERMAKVVTTIHDLVGD